MAQYRLKTPKVIQDSVGKAYRKVEHGVVGTYKKIEGKFVDTFLQPVPKEGAAADAERKEP